MLGDYVYAQQTLIYDVAGAREYLADLNAEMPTDEEILELINSWAGEEFGWGEYTLTDSEGNEV